MMYIKNHKGKGNRMFRLRLKTAFLVLFKWQRCYGVSGKDTSFICGSSEKHYSISITKPLYVNKESK